MSIEERNEIPEDEACADCLRRLDDPEYHCPQCGDHVDGIGECNSGCEL